MSVRLDMSAIRTISGMSGVDKQLLVSVLKEFYKSTEQLFANSQQAYSAWFRLASDIGDDDCLEELTAYCWFNRLFIQEIETSSLDLSKKQTIPFSPARLTAMKRLRLDFPACGESEPKAKQAIAESPTYACTKDAFVVCRTASVGSPEYVEAMACYNHLFIEDLKKVKSATDVQNMARRAIRGSLAERTAKILGEILGCIETIRRNPQSVYDIVYVYESLTGWSTS